MFIAALFTIVKLWKQPRCSTPDKWIKKMSYLYTMEFYSATKKNENLSFAGKWMELENIVLSEVSQLRRPKITCSPSYVDYRPKTNAVILLDIGHTLRGECTQEEEGKERKPKVEGAQTMYTHVSKCKINKI
jgi:hypothetical protein